MAETENSLPTAPVPQPHAPLRLNLGIARSRTNKIFAGVAGGLGERFAVDPFVVRLAFLVLATAGGAGLVAYILLWAVSNKSKVEDASVFPARKPSLKQSIAVGFIVIGVLLVLRAAGLWFGDALSWSIAAAAIGSSIIWARSDEEERTHWRDVTSRWPANPVQGLVADRVSPARIAAGGLLIAGGMAAFLAANDALVAIRDVSVAVGVTVIGLTLIFGPWTWRLARAAVDERRARIRSQERAEMAAHLHDSVLQTLALIQRSESTREMAALARGQERELRSWLYGRPQTQDGHLSAAIENAAAQVEAKHRIPVNVVIVGDCDLDDRTEALVHACREAMTNAAKHSQTPSISVYVEVEDESISAFVRDTGGGFIPSQVPKDRAGITGSIVGRIERHGGEATIVSKSGAGTEVRIRVPRGSS
jgi:signal transduction histidine kinase/phage shock protein PspC (stress-responsive transcriptional regulator)